MSNRPASTPDPSEQTVLRTAEALEAILTEVLAVSPICLATFDAAGTITYAAGSGYAGLDINPDDTVGENMLVLCGDNVLMLDGIQTCLSGRSVDLVTEVGGRVWDCHYRPQPGPGGDVSGGSGGISITQDATAWLSTNIPLAPGEDADAGEPPVIPLMTRAVTQPLLGFLERDDVTALLGRRGLRRRLSEPVAAGSSRAVAVLDVDAFSLINETYGAALADQVLRVLANRLNAAAGVGLLGRWHADEFVLVLDATDASEQLDALVGVLLAVAREPLPVADMIVQVGMSAGLASSAEAPAGDLVAAARQALRTAKQAGRNRVEWFHAQLAQLGSPGVGLADDLRAGVTEQQLRLDYQPILQLNQHKVSGVEALVRWQHPTRGLLNPDQFIDMAERTGLIVPLGDWVLEQACHAAATLTDTGEGLQTVAVNLSARQLTDGGLVERVQGALEQAHCRAGALVLEVTETALMADMSTAIRTLEQLKVLGIQLALDDFGTGYSSLLYLKHFPVDTLKIDRSFVSGLGNSPDDSAIVASTISLAHTMGIVCVAEGVETLDQLALLTSMQCEFGQGYLFSRPLPLHGLHAWLDEHTNHHRHSRRLTASPALGPDAAEIMRMHADAASIHTIAAALNTAGRRTSRGTRWTAQTVARVIANTQYPALDLTR